jgi:hypothetical protein
MGLLSYIEAHKLRTTPAPGTQKSDTGGEDWSTVNPAFFAQGFVANLFTLDFSALTGTPGRNFAEVYDALAAILAPPSRCYPAQKSTIKVVFAGDQELPVDLFSAHIKSAMTPFFQSPAMAEHIRCYPGGLARTQGGVDSFLNAA